MRRIQDVLEDAGVVAAELAGARDRLWQAGEGDLDAAARVLGEVARAAEALLVGVVAEAQERGTIAGSRCASAAAWVRERAGEREHGTAGAVAMLAAATQGPGGESLRQALWEDGIGVRLAAKAVREADRTLPLLPGADRSEVVGHYLDRAAATDGSRRALDQLTREILARYGDDVLDELDERARAVNSLTVARRVGGRVRYTLELCVPDAARLDAAVNGLAAPRPAATAVCDGDGPPALVADTRSAAQRRADALLELVARAQAADADPSAGGCGLSGSTTLVVTADVEAVRATLEGRPAPHGWARGPAPVTDRGRAGYGTTSGGEVLSAGEVRRMACDAGVLPQMLGGPSTPLDTGRVDRAATNAMRSALLTRDGGCTAPGCDRPPGWCEAHHVTHWSEGGPTSLANLALLCRRHHTIVHRDGLRAAVYPDRVVWWDPACEPPPDPTGQVGPPPAVTTGRPEPPPGTQVA
ncbi:HNH endonuclease signature motif containing protein [Kytococcus schroeteri]|uniref:HNH endonuclease signature motif containing protein n=1 Tax=Kytococcus schroeteri TaxID=138300 RepID=UPI001144FB6E|nr:HNH endonuclease signature motif containing protein [Kytococcus schroeteri]